MSEQTAGSYDVGAETFWLSPWNRADLWEQEVASTEIADALLPHLRATPDAAPEDILPALVDAVADYVARAAAAGRTSTHYASVAL